MDRLQVRGEILNLVISVLRDVYKSNDDDFINYLNFFFDYGIDENSLKSFETLHRINELEGRLDNGTTTK